jgi:hypothetical protein
MTKLHDVETMLEQALSVRAEIRDKAKLFDDLLEFGYCLYEGQWLHLREHGESDG